MKQAIKEQWITALRSGEYKQGRAKLKRELDSGDWRYCCLGVLCELAISDGVLNEVYPHDTVLPKAVMKWSGIATESANYNGDSECLANDNDDGMPFAQIADIIEREF